MALPGIHGEFIVTGEPELRFNDKGDPWVKIRGRAADRVKDGDAWKDGPALFVDITVSGKFLNNSALNIVESVSDRDTIIVSGKLEQREWEKDGVKQYSYQISASFIGISARWDAWKKVPRAASSGSASVARDMLGATDVAPF